MGSGVTDRVHEEGRRHIATNCREGESRGVERLPGGVITLSRMTSMMQNTHSR